MPQHGRLRPTGHDEGAALASAPRAIAWTADRHELQQLLTKQHLDLGGFYELAVAELSNGLTFPRLVIAAHCLRELVSGLPVVLGDDTAARSDVSRPAHELAKAWEAAGLDRLIDVDDFDDDALHPIPGNVLRDAAAVAKAGAVGTRNARALTALLATGDSADANDPLIRRLHDAIEFFRRWAHYRDYSTARRPLPAAGKVEEELRIIEDALLTRFGNLADRARTLRDIIASANQRTMEERS